jgi:diguanylate cyclase (GGDEF)-like protein
MRKNGERFPVVVVASTVTNELGEAVSFVATVTDITERKRTQDQIYRLAFYDPLTNLPNRRLLTDRMSQTLAACKRSGKFAALIVLDLDNFKPLNDTYGHAAGDLLLIEVAQRIKACVREVDTVARFGGDEFVVLIQELSGDRDMSKEQVSGIAEKIRFLLSQPYRLMRNPPDWLEHHCTASLGVALCSEAVPDVADALKHADQAMYQAKTEGRNRVCLYDPAG